MVTEWLFFVCGRSNTDRFPLFLFFLKCRAALIVTFSQFDHQAGLLEVLLCVCIVRNPVNFPSRDIRAFFCVWCEHVDLPSPLFERFKFSGFLMLRVVRVVVVFFSTSFCSLVLVQRRALRPLFRGNGEGLGTRLQSFLSLNYCG